MLRYALLTFAQKINVGGSNPDVSNVPTAGGDQVLTNILNIFYFLVGAVAVIVIIVAGMMYAFSAGSPGTVTKAKNMIIYAVVGLVVAASAFTITGFVSGRF